MVWGRSGERGCTVLGRDQGEGGEELAEKGPCFTTVTLCHTRPPIRTAPTPFSAAVRPQASLGSTVGVDYERGASLLPAVCRRGAPHSGVGALQGTVEQAVATGGQNL